MMRGTSSFIDHSECLQTYISNTGNLGPPHRMFIVEVKFCAILHNGQSHKLLMVIKGTILEGEQHHAVENSGQFEYTAGKYALNGLSGGWL